MTRSSVLERRLRGEPRGGAADARIEISLARRCAVNRKDPNRHGGAADVAVLDRRARPDPMPVSRLALFRGEVVDDASPCSHSAECSAPPP